MTIFAETERLILREIVPADAKGMFALDSDPEVHRYLGNKPVQDIEQIHKVIEFIRQQYVDNGIGRWAVVEKETNTFLGWSGLKYVTEATNNHINYHDLGYRLIREYWGRGFATESALASRDYAFQQLQLPEIYASVDIGNMASRRVLEKAGLRYVESFQREGSDWFWMTLTRKEWEQR